MDCVIRQSVFDDADPPSQPKTPLLRGFIVIGGRRALPPTVTVRIRPAATASAQRPVCEVAMTMLFVFVIMGTTDEWVAGKAEPSLVRFGNVVGLVALTRLWRAEPSATRRVQALQGDQGLDASLAPSEA